MNSQDDQRGSAECLGNVVCCRKDMALSENHLVAVRMRRGEEGSEQWSRSLVLLFVDVHDQAIS